MHTIDGAGERKLILNGTEASAGRRGSESVFHNQPQGNVAAWD